MSTISYWATEEARTKCQGFRDIYFKCLRMNKEDKSFCGKEKTEFDEHCLPSWVQHFESKRAQEMRTLNIIAPQTK